MKIIRLMLKKTGVSKGLYLAVIFLSIFGIIMIGDASVGMSVKYGTTYAPKNMIKQAIFILIGMILMIYFSKKYHSQKINQRITGTLYAICVGLMIICRIWTINGSHAWIVLPGIGTIQPVEFMKISLIIYLSYSFGELPKHYRFISGSIYLKKQLQDKKLYHCLLYPIGAIGFAFMLCAFWQKDLGSALILALISYMIFLGTDYKMYRRMKRLSIILLSLGIVVFVIGGGLALQTHQMSRFESWLKPLNDIYGSSYQIVNGLVGYVTGGLTGKGFGNSVMKYGYIPESQNDYISAIIVEELGLVGFLFIIIPYCAIIFILFRYVFKVKYNRDKLTLIGIATYFFAHLLVNIGGVSGMIPMTGVPLLLISAGGSSTVAALLLIGIAQAIITRHNREKLQEEYEWTTNY